MIEIKDISKNFENIQALKNINFTLPDMGIAALIGENGAGKSTLMRIMCGYLAPSCGCIKIYGHDVFQERIEALLHIGYVPEISALYGDMSVYDFLAWIAGIWNVSDKQKAIQTVSQQLKISGVLRNSIDSLSKGFKKRIEIASAILHQPDFLILDEPTDGLDPNQKYDIRQFMKSYAEKHFVLISTHVLEDIDVADRVIMLSEGNIINDTNIDDFKKISKNQSMSEAFRILSKHLKGNK